MKKRLTRASTFIALGLVIGVDAGAASVRVRAMAVPPLSIARVTAGPAGALACLDWKTGRVKAVTPQGADARIDLAIPVAAQITNIGGGDGQMVVTTAQHGTFVLGQDGSVRGRFATARFTPYIAATIDRDSAFGMGSAGDETGHIRTDWLITRIDLKTPSAVARDLVNDTTFADPFARAIFPLGYLLLSADHSTLYALWEGSPVLYLIPTAGGSTRTITLTAGADAPPRATPALRSSVISDRNAFYQIRSKFRWPQGLLRGPNGLVAVLFREPAARGNAFTVDIYSREGKKVGATLPLGVEPRSATAHARTVATTDGRQYVIINEPNSDYSGVKNQRLYAIDINP